MRGIVNRALNERLQASVNSTILRFYEERDAVDIVEAVPGDEYDGDDLWYKLTTGGYVWSGGVDLESECKELAAEDKDQFLVSFRKVLSDGRPDMKSKSPADTLYFTPVRLPASTSSIRTNTLNPNTFASYITQSVRELKNPRRHVMVYIHGYQLLSSLKLDLLASYVQNHMLHPANKIAKVIFMTWPAHDLSRKTVDDRSIKAGEHFTALNLWQPFEQLSNALRAEGCYLNLVVHSFGHQLLNGMLNPTPVLTGANKIFENVFLMASDVTHMVVKKDGIKQLPNYYKDVDGLNFDYGYAGLNKLTNRVHVFHDKYDYLLYSSTKKFVGNSNIKNADDVWALTKNYRSLGNYGKSAPLNPGSPVPEFTLSDLIPDLNFVDVNQLFKEHIPGPLVDFPFREIRKGPARAVDQAVTQGDYSDINLGNLFLNIKRFPDHHRYLFTCKPVVDEVMKLLK